jgi:hypothetical protein
MRSPFLLVVAMLLFTVPSALASSTSLSRHTIAAYTKMYYWSGSGGYCNNAFPWGISMSQTFASKISWTSGIADQSSELQEMKDTSKYVTYVARPLGVSKLKFWTKNLSSSDVICTKGTIGWSLT